MAITGGKIYLGTTAVEACNIIKLGTSNVNRMFVGESIIFPSVVFSLVNQYYGTNSSDVCNRTGTYPVQMFWVDCSSLDVGDYVWTDSGRTTLATTGYYGGGGYSSTYYYIVNGVVSSINTCPCDPTPNLQSQGYVTCSGCTNYTVYRDINSCSGTYLHYYVNGSSVGTSAPSNGSCNYNAVYSSYVGTLCSGCVNYDVYQNTNPCFGGNQYYATNGSTYSSNPSTGGCNFSQILTNQGYSTCVGCTTYTVYKDTNPCSSTHNHYFVNDSDVGTSAPTSGGCNTFPTYTNQNYQTCYNCLNQNVYKDTNLCSSTYNHYFVEYNGTYTDFGTGAPTGVTCNYSPTLVSQGYNTCVSCTSYLVYKDTNSCSSTYNHYFVNGNDVGTSAPSSDPCPSTTYYALTPCSSNTIYTTTQYTTINPAGGYGQRYIYPSFPNSDYFYYQGTSVSQCAAPGGYNGSIQIVSGASYCP